VQYFYGTIFDSPDALFDKSYIFSDAKAEKLQIQNTVMTVNSRKKSAMKWSQLCQRIELFIRKMILRFEMSS
jgi:hypothetical protein